MTKESVAKATHTMVALEVIVIEATYIMAEVANKVEMAAKSKAKAEITKLSITCIANLGT